MLDEGSVSIESENADKLTTRLHGQKYEEWLSANNGFSYELIVPASLRAKTHSIMQQDLDNVFPEFSASMEKRAGRALVLTAASNGKHPGKASAESKRKIELDIFGWQVANSSLAAIVSHFNQTQNHPLPMIDQTGIKGRIDLQVEGNVSDLDGLNKALSVHGLQLIEKQVERDILVIRDREIARN